jgi:hypothetical protein
LPMPAIWGLQMALKKRLLVLFMFSFGFIACIAALVRFSTLAYTKDSTDMTCMAPNSSHPTLITLPTSYARTPFATPY